MKYFSSNGDLVDIAVSDEKWLDDKFFTAQMNSLPNDAPRAGLAYRVSTKGQVDHDDIPMQKIECRKFCVQRGWRVVFERAEKGVSGSKVLAADRDVIQEIRNDALNNSFDILLVFMFDRLGRIESETPFVLEWFVNHGIEMWSTREGQQKIETHDDKLINYLRFWQAAGESEKISTRIRTRVRQIVSSGHYAGGTVPFGYQAVYRGRKNKKDMPVKDLEIQPDEAVIVQEIFNRVAQEGYSAYTLARNLNEHGIKTHNGTKFQANNILRIIRHQGYTGYIATKNTISDHIPELEIVSKELFAKANAVCKQRCDANAEARSVAHSCENPTLLAGIIYCAHCGAKLSGFVHNDRYKLRDGTIQERLQPKYNCFQRAQKVRDCDGQALYKADVVDALVLEVVREIFKNIRTQPSDRTLEQRLKQKSQINRRQKLVIEKKIATAKQALTSYENEVFDCINGTSEFSKDMLSRLISKAETELKIAKIEYAQLQNDAENECETLRKIDAYYNEFTGWAEEFELAPIARKRMILSQLLTKVELGTKYAVTVEINMSYKQFLEMDREQGSKAEVVA